MACAARQQAATKQLSRQCLAWGGRSTGSPALLLSAGLADKAPRLPQSFPPWTLWRLLMSPSQPRAILFSIHGAGVSLEAARRHCRDPLGEASADQKRKEAEEGPHRARYESVRVSGAAGVTLRLRGLGRHGVRAERPPERAVWCDWPSGRWGRSGLGWMSGTEKPGRLQAPYGGRPEMVSRLRGGIWRPTRPQGNRKGRAPRGTRPFVNRRSRSRCYYLAAAVAAAACCFFWMASAWSLRRSASASSRFCSAGLRSRKAC